jgi:hypothetical protein
MGTMFINLTKPDSSCRQAEGLLIRMYDEVLGALGECEDSLGEVRTEPDLPQLCTALKQAEAVAQNLHKKVAGHAQKMQKLRSDLRKTETQNAQNTRSK